MGKRRTNLLLISVVAALLAVSGVLVPGTFSTVHILEIARQSVPLGIVAMGQSLVIRTGGTDLAIGQLITMTNILCTDLMRGRNSGAWLIMLFLVLLAAGIGAVNGAVISRTNVPPMVMTFGMASIVRGAFLLYSRGTPKGSVAPILRTIGAGRIGLVPVSLVLLAVIAVLFQFFERRTKWGRSLAFVGSNPRAALYSGLPVRSRIVGAYAVSGMCAGIAGLILSGYIGVGNFDIGGDAYTMDSIGASVVGGNTFTGEGGAVGTVLGSLIMTVVGSVMTSMGIGEAGKLVVRSIIILAMVATYTPRSLSRRKARSVS